MENKKITLLNSDGLTTEYICSEVELRDDGFIYITTTEGDLFRFSSDDVLFMTKDLNNV